MTRPWHLRGGDLLAAVSGLVWFFLLGGARTLQASQVDWLGVGDWASQYSAWQLYRQAPLGWPLGGIPGLLFPVGTTVALSDSIALVAVPLRLFSAALPDSFQYIGWWLAGCFILQGVAGARLASRWTGSAWLQALAGALWVLSPPLTLRLVDERMRHPSLCAQWLVVMALALALRRIASQAEARRALWHGLLLALVAAWVHPVLMVMVVLLVMALAARLVTGRLLTVAACGGGLALMVVLLAATLWALGYATPSAATAGGFGVYSADLLTLVNPMQWSVLLGPLPMGEGQYEGAAYLGAGVLVVGLASVPAVRAEWPRVRGALREHRPLLMVCVVAAIFALATPVTLAGHPLVGLGWLYGWWPSLTGAFRSSGRFVWPLYALVVSGALGALLLRESVQRVRVTAVLLGAVLLQAVELAPATAAQPFRGVDWQLHSPVWRLAEGTVQHVALVPPFIPGGGPACVGPYPWDYPVPLADLAVRLKATFNSGFIPRVDEARLEPVCEALMRAMAQGPLDPQTLYVVPSDAISRIAPSVATCAVVEDRGVCLAAGIQTPLRWALDCLARAPGAEQACAQRGAAVR